MEFDPNSTLKISVATPNNYSVSVREEHEMILSPNIDPIQQPASLLESGLLEFNDNQLNCTEVITEQPSQYHDLLYPEGDNEDESAESVAIVEQVLSTTHINEANGFILNHRGSMCCPRWVIVPTLNLNLLAPRGPEEKGWYISGSSNDKCHCCCCFPPISIGGQKKWQTMTLKHNEQEILNFLYSPMICCCRARKNSLVHIYIPQRNQRIAVLKRGDRFSDGAILIDCVSKLVFTVKKLDIGSDYGATGMTIFSQDGTEIAVGTPIKGVYSRKQAHMNWTFFELKFNPNIPSDLLSASSKSVVMVGFAMWATNLKEEEARDCWIINLIAIIALIFCFGIFIAYDSISSS